MCYHCHLLHLFCLCCTSEMRHIWGFSFFSILSSAPDHLVLHSCKQLNWPLWNLVSQPHTVTRHLKFLSDKSDESTAYLTTLFVPNTLIRPASVISYTASVCQWAASCPLIYFLFFLIYFGCAACAWEGYELHNCMQ